MSNFIMILIGIVVLESVAAYVLLKLLKNEKEKSKQLAADVEKQKQNSIYLARHIEELAKIEKSKNKEIKKIKDAKSDEEIYDIINTVISANNQLCNNNKS